MKVSELRQILSGRPSDDHHADDEVVVLLASPSIGPHACMPIRSAGYGFDWDNGKLLLWTDQPLVVKSDKQRLYDRTYDMLFMLSGETRHYKGEDRLTPLALKVRELFKEVGRRPRKIGTFTPEED